MPWSDLVNPFRTLAVLDDTPEGDIFEVAEEALPPVNQMLADFHKHVEQHTEDKDSQIHLLREMLEAVVAENNELREKYLAAKNDADRLKKKLQST